MPPTRPLWSHCPWLARDRDGGATGVDRTPEDARHWPTRLTSARQRIRHGIRHTAARAGWRPRRCVANGRLRHILIGYAPVSKADGSQSLDLQRDALRAANMHGRESVQRSRRTSAALTAVRGRPVCAGMGGRPLGYLRYICDIYFGFLSEIGAVLVGLHG